MTFDNKKKHPDQLEREEHFSMASETGGKYVSVVGTPDGTNYYPAIVDASGSLKTTGSGGGGGGTVDQGVGGSSPWLVKVDQTGTNNDVDANITNASLAVTGPLTDTELRATPVPVSGTVTTGGLTDTQLRATPVPVSGPLTDTELRATPVPVSGTVTADTEMTTKDYDTGGGIDMVATVGILLPASGGSAAGGTATNPLRIDPTGGTTQPVSGSLNTTEQQVIADNFGFTDGTNKVWPAGYILDEVAGTALTENDAAAARIDSKRAQICTIEDETTRGRRTTVTAANALKVDGSAVTQPVSQGTAANLNATIVGTGTLAVQDSQVIADNAGFTDGTSKVFMAGHVFDEVAGTALTENDAAASRIDSKRAQVVVLEDATTRGRRLAVNADGSVTITPSGTQAVTGTVAVSTVAGTVTVDTELPAAAALADGTTNPTTPLIGSCLEKFDGSTWDRVQHSFVQITATVATGGGLGTVVDMSNSPKHKFAISVQKDGGTVSAYNIDLLGALQNWSFDTILSNNTSVTGGAQLIWTTEKPVRFMRYKVNSVTGAAGTVTIIIFACE